MSRRQLQFDELSATAVAYLSVEGLSSGANLSQKLKISSASLSRLLKHMNDKVFMFGRGPSVRYAAARNIKDTGSKFPIYEILVGGKSRKFATLFSVAPSGFYLEFDHDKRKSSFYHDLPYFLNDMRPGGFLGRLIPLQIAVYGLPKDIRDWSADHCLAYLSKFGWNSVGNFIVGDNSFARFLDFVRSGHRPATKDKKDEYDEKAVDVLLSGEPGSSAVGEQPKFLVIEKDAQFIVKFSPPLTNEIATRVADLLICEHTALDVLNKNGIAAANSNLVLSKRVYLEVERFDRLPHNGRKGIISLGSLDAEFSGIQKNWRTVAQALVQKKVIKKEDFQTIKKLEIFGELTANSDMHLYNISFFTSGVEVTELAPIYDMTPMLYAPRDNQIIECNFQPPTPTVHDADVWIDVAKLAIRFWSLVSKDERISQGFRNIAAQNQAKIEALLEVGQILPKA